MTSSKTMMDLSCNKSTEGNLDVREEESSSSDSTAVLDCKPKDLSVRTNMRRSKPIPPPLILKSEIHPESSIGISTALNEFAILATGPYSPLMQKNLPFRKRAHSVPDAIDNGPLSAPPTMLKFYPNIFFKQEKSDDEKDSHPPLNLSLPPTPKGCSGGRDTESPLGPSASVSSTNSELTSQVVTSSSHPSSPRPRLSSSTTDQHINPAHQSYTRHHFPPWSPYLPTPSMMASHWLNGSPSALLSPAPSSLGSSQEDLRLAATHSVPLSSVSNLVFESDPWRLPWPYPVWHCFQLGTLVRFSLNSSDIVLRAEEINQCSELQFLTPERLGPLCVQCIKPLDSKGVVEISFSCSHSMSNDIKIVATCYSYHTFLVMEKGWCAVSPESVLRQYGIQCQPLECSDCCALPPKMPSVSSPGICEKFKRFSFSPEELGSSAPPPPPPGSLILSPPNTPTMKSQHTQLQQSQPQTQQHPRQAPSKQSKSSKQKNPQQTSEKSTKTKAPLDPNRPKRPMNAFMLFAKQHRLKLIRMHPGKDNRFVSVILGETWRSLPADQKEVFITEAKALSHERKRLHPECWKRKRSLSTS